MDTRIGENEPLTLSHCQWLGLKNVNGALVREGMKGEVQFYDGKFHYCEKNVAVKTLHTCKDLNDIVIPIANAEIAERNAASLTEQCCPKCGSRSYYYWREGGPKGSVINAKCDECNYVWNLRSVGTYCRLFPQ